LVLNGEDDSYVPQKERDAFKKQMDSAQIDYQFINYPGAIHSFTNPNSTAIGKKYDMKVAYNKSADEKSWQEMKTFFDKIFK
jgi:dienelactone hydrolase